MAKLYSNSEYYIVQIPPVLSENPTQSTHAGSTDGSREKSNLNSMQQFTVSLKCRTIQIGSHIFTPKRKVYISNKGIKIVAPSLKNETMDAALQINTNEVCRILVHFDKALPVIFLYHMSNCARNITTALGMVENSGPYNTFSKFPVSRITLLPEAISEKAKMALKAVFGKVIGELNLREANYILTSIEDQEGLDNWLRTRSGDRKRNKYDDSDQHRKSFPVIEGLHQDVSELSGPDAFQNPSRKNQRIPEVNIPQELLKIKKQKMDVELALAKEQLQIAKRKRYKLDLELFKSEKELNISASNFTAHLYDLQYEKTFLNGVTVKEEQA